MFKMLSLSIRPSRSFAGLMGLVYILTGVMCCYMPLGYRFKLVGLMIHAIHFYTVWYSVLTLQSPGAVVFLQYVKGWGWMLRHQSGDEHSGILQRGSVCTRYFSVLCFIQLPLREPRYVIILPDSVTETEFRQLRKLLWWGL